MKAKVIKTGEIVDVEMGTYSNLYHNLNYNGSGRGIFNENELDFNLDNSQKQRVTIEGWVTRNIGNAISISNIEPIRADGYWDCEGNQLYIPSDSFPNLKWSDEPLPVTIQITER